jgi:thioredoxin
MKRREFIALSGAATLTPLLAQAAQKSLVYTPGLVDELLAKGDTVFVDFFTTWCSTCRAQGRNIEALRDANPAYDEAMTFVKVDWDIYSEDALSVWLNIPRRSTLVVLRGEDELGRIVANTSKTAIKNLMDLGLGVS